jgi:hypothetical protein
MSYTIPQCTFAEIQKATHPLHTDNPTEFLRVIFDFLKEIFLENWEKNLTFKMRNENAK